MDFAIDSEERPQGTLVRLTGDIDLLSAPSLRTTLDDLVARGVMAIVVDLGGVAFLDSSGLGALVGALKKIRADRAGTIRLAAPPPRVAKILELTGINQVFDVLPTVDAAFALAPPA